MRVSEVLALRWEHIDFEAGAMLVQQGVVNGRIGKVKTEASNDSDSAADSEASRGEGWPPGDRIAHLPAYVSLFTGRDECAGWRSTKADAAQQRGNDHERVRQRELEGKAAGQFKGGGNGNLTEFAPNGATKGGCLTFCGVLWGWGFDLVSVSY
jgi:hypothetical protein